MFLLWVVVFLLFFCFTMFYQSLSLFEFWSIVALVHVNFPYISLRFFISYFGHVLSFSNGFFDSQDPYRCFLVLPPSFFGFDCLLGSWYLLTNALNIPLQCSNYPSCGWVLKSLLAFPVVLVVAEESLLWLGGSNASPETHDHHCLVSSLFLVVLLYNDNHCQQHQHHHQHHHLQHHHSSLFCRSACLLSVFGIPDKRYSFIIRHSASKVLPQLWPFRPFVIHGWFHCSLQRLGF